MMATPRRRSMARIFTTARLEQPSHVEVLRQRGALAHPPDLRVDVEVMQAYPANEGGRDFQAEGHPAARIEEPEGVTKNAGLEDACGGMLEKAAAGPLHRDETEGDPERGIEPRALEDRRRKTAFGAHFPCVLRVT